jgi:hypothetical protein
MPDFCPDGYAPLQHAVSIAAQFWFPEKVASIETAATGKTRLHARSLPFAQRPGAFQQAFEEIAEPTVLRLRNFLHQGKITAYYFTGNGCHSLPREFWATTEANEVIESGTYWPLGSPTKWYDRRPKHPIFVKQSDLDVLLVNEAAENRRFPLSKKSELAAAYRRPEIAALPSRRAQREAIKQLEQFKSYHITDKLFREAEQASGPRRPGIKRRQKD